MTIEFSCSIKGDRVIKIVLRRLLFLTNKEKIKGKIKHFLLVLTQQLN